MRKTFAIGSAAIAGLIVVAALFTPVDAELRGPMGPDVVASRIGLNSGDFGFHYDDISYTGTVGGIRGYALASTSCNVGDTPAEWMDSKGNARNPVIAQNLYRLAADESRFEHIGMSWVKHSFCAVNEGTCGTCIGTDCNTLGVGCADTYSSGLNGSAAYLGPRWHINPQGVGVNGVHNDIYPAPSGPTEIAGRLQVKEADIVADARYFAEIQYVTHDEHYTKRWNNASYREVQFDGTEMTGIVANQSSVVRESAIHAWAAENPDVAIALFEDVGLQGRFELGVLVTDNGDDTWTYEYALRNHNSELAANRFAVPVQAGVSVTNTGFHDVDYHSGDGWNDIATFDGTDWPADTAGGDVDWSCADFTTDANANALRWGTMYNFRFTADAPPMAGTVSVGMYKGQTSDIVTVATQVPGEPVQPCATDIAEDDDVTNVFDLLELLANWGSDGNGADIADPTDVVNVFDLLDLLAAWGDC